MAAADIYKSFRDRLEQITEYHYWPNSPALLIKQNEMQSDEDPLDAIARHMTEALVKDGKDVNGTGDG